MMKHTNILLIPQNQSPQEKAKELYFKMMEHSFGGDSEQAKQCALIAVDEILKAIDWHEFEVPNDQLNYWQQVKQEIEKL